MNFTPLFNGTRLRLAPPQPGDHEQIAAWTLDDVYLRLLDNDPAKPHTPESYAAWEASFWNAPDTFPFRLRTLDDNKLVGFVVLGGVQWTNQVGSLGIAVSPEEWGKGYGTEAMRLILRYGFTELNLYRVNSSTIGYNTRSIRAHEKAGFRREGVQRAAIQRAGQRYDVITFGILRDDWQAMPDV